MKIIGAEENFKGAQGKKEKKSAKSEFWQTDLKYALDKHV